MSNEQNAVVVREPESQSLSLKQVTDRVNMVHAVLQKVMKNGTHYGVVPGCGSKKVLLKPGADVLAITFRLVPSFDVRTTELPNLHREFSVTCTMTGPDGTLLGQGVGSASTMEKKYRYRHGPNNEKIENEDIADVYNTVLKMAKKRAHIDATLTVTGAADIFTQDMIDEDGTAGGEAPISEPKAKPKAKQEAAQDGCQIVTGTLDDVSVKSGTGKKGTWTKFGLQIGGAWYGTFDKDIGELAQSLKGKEVSVIWKQDGEYKTVQSVAEDVPPPSGDSTPGAGDSAVVQDLMAYESGLPRMFAKGCDHVHISAAEWKSAPSEALAKLKAWLDVESTRG